MADDSLRKRQADQVSTTSQVANVKKARVSETCDWIFEDNVFREWQNELTEESIIWVHGPVGSGKTFVAERVYEVLSEFFDVPTVCYFCNATSTPLMMLSSIVDQLSNDSRLLPSSSGVVREARDELDSQTQMIPHTVHAAWDIFETAMADIPSCNLIIDGLDELSAEYLSDDNLNVARRFEHFVKHKSQGWKLYVSSRTSPSSIQDVFQHYPSIPLTADKTDHDMRRFAVSRVRQHPYLVPFEARIVNWLVKRAEGIFIWAHLAVQALSREEDLSSVTQRLDTYSVPLDDLYTILLTRNFEKQSLIDTRIRNIILAWVLNSVRPMNLSELGNAIYVCDSIYVADIGKTIVQTCGPLLKIEANTVVPLHQSLREYISSANRDVPWINSIRGSTAHQLISTACMRFITQLDVSNDLFNTLNKDDVRYIHPLLEYATLYWVHHLCAAIPSNSTLVDDATSFFDTKNAFNWSNKFLPMFLSNSVLDVPPRRIDSAPIAYLFQLRSQILSTLSDPDRKSSFESETSRSLISHYQEALAQSTSTASPTDPTNQIRHMLLLGEVYGWIQNHTTDSSHILTAAFTQVDQQNLHSSPDPATQFLALTAQHAHADSLKRAGKYSAAHTIFRHVVDGYNTLTQSHPYHTGLSSSSSHPSLHSITTNHFFALDTLGWTCTRLNLPSDAATHLTTALSLTPSVFGSLSPATLRTKTTLATVLSSLNRRSEADTLCNELLAVLSPPSSTSNSNNNNNPKKSDLTTLLLAQIHTTQSNFPRAIQTYQSLVSQRTQGYGPNHPMTLGAEMQLGLVREKRLAVTPNSTPGSITTAGAETDINAEQTGDGSREDGGKEELIAFFEALIRRQIAVLGETHPDVKCCREAVGRLKGEDSEGWEVV